MARFNPTKWTYWAWLWIFSLFYFPPPQVEHDSLQVFDKTKETHGICNPHFPYLLPKVSFQCTSSWATSTWFWHIKIVFFWRYEKLTVSRTSCPAGSQRRTSPSFPWECDRWGSDSPRQWALPHWVSYPSSSFVCVTHNVGKQQVCIWLKKKITLSAVLTNTAIESFLSSINTIQSALWLFPITRHV